MGRRVFFSFEYAKDVTRVSQVRNMGRVEDKPLLSANEWESVRRNGDSAVERWIKEQMRDKSCLVVLIGSSTSQRRWVQYEIEHAWNKGMGVVGIYIHNLKNIHGFQTHMGTSPFASFTINNIYPMTQVVKSYDPPYQDSRQVYAHINANIERWVEEAINIRQRY
jgi:hypothetical protein